MPQVWKFHNPLLVLLFIRKFYRCFINWASINLVGIFSKVKQINMNTIHTFFISSCWRVHCGVDFGTAENFFKRAALFNHTLHKCKIIFWEVALIILIRCEISNFSFAWGENVNDLTKRLLLDFQSLSPWVARLPEMLI